MSVIFVDIVFQEPITSKDMLKLFMKVWKTMSVIFVAELFHKKILSKNMLKLFTRKWKTIFELLSLWKGLSKAKGLKIHVLRVHTGLKCCISYRTFHTNIKAVLINVIFVDLISIKDKCDFCGKILKNCIT